MTCNWTHINTVCKVCKCAILKEIDYSKDFINCDTVCQSCRKVKIKEDIEEFLDTFTECEPKEIEAVKQIISWTDETRAGFLLAYKIWKDKKDGPTE